MGAGLATDKPSGVDGYVYRNWACLAGYFDGDGTVEFRVLERRVEVRLAFDDNWKPFLEGVRAFLLSKDVVAGLVRRKVQSKTWHIVISGGESVKLMCRRMLPYSTKKQMELSGVLSYLNSQISGAQFVELMNDQVRKGQRTRKIRPGGPPYTKGDAARIGRAIGVKHMLETRWGDQAGSPLSSLVEDKKRLNSSPLVGR
jgi:intein/homing endonuclease